MRFLSYTLVFSTYLPVSVYGTVIIRLTLEVFLGNFFDKIGSAKALPLGNLWYYARGFACELTKSRQRLNHKTLYIQNSVTPLKTYNSAGILTSSSIGYAAWPRLRAD